jgi:hypothetical protein
MVDGTVDIRLQANAVRILWEISYEWLLDDPHPQSVEGLVRE